MDLQIYLWAPVMKDNLPILRISNLTLIKKNYSKIRDYFTNDNMPSNIGYLVNGMNLTIVRNKIHGIVGESGSGKSLTMKSILGLIDFSPGIINGQIQYNDGNNIIEVIPRVRNDDETLGFIKRIKYLFMEKHFLYHTEYFVIEENELAFKLNDEPVIQSILVYYIDTDLNCIPAEFIPPSRENPRLIQLKSIIGDSHRIGVKYLSISNFSSVKNQKQINIIQKKTGLRGEKISMILQDPQTFLNPYWSIGTQIENQIKLKNKRIKDPLYYERNFTLRIIGSKQDFPIMLKWDKTSTKRYLRQADIWVDGISHSMLSNGEITIKEGNSRFWGTRLLTRKFILVIHPGNSKEKINIKWNRTDLRANVLQATISYPDNADVDLVNIYNLHQTIIDPAWANEKNNILVEIDLILGTGDDFLLPLNLIQLTDTVNLLIGLEKGATDGLDPLKGEKPIAMPKDELFAGFVIEENPYEFTILSHNDIRAPINILNAEITLSITPKYEQDYIGSITCMSSANHVKTVEYGLLNSATEGLDAHIGEIDLSNRLQEGKFDAGFVINDIEGHEKFSPKDFRNIVFDINIDKEVSALLAKVDLDDEHNEFRKQFPRSISGGQGQRVMISLAMSAKPELLIADEPTTGLDVTKQREIVNLFKQYKLQGRTIMLISHDLSFVRHLADNYTIVYAGVDVEHLPKSILGQKDQLHPYTKRLLDIAENDQEEHFDFIKKDIPDPFNRSFQGCPFEPRCTEKEKIDLPEKQHPCKQLYPPMVNANTGQIMINNTDTENHYVRCWLFIKQ